MLKNSMVFTLIVALLFLCNVSQAQLGDDRPKSDKRVENALNELDVDFEIDDDGDFRVIFELESGRTQLAFVRSSTLDYGNMEIREIWSYGYRSPSDQFPPAVANLLLEDTFPKKMGAWSKSGDLAVFMVRISANADAKSLMWALRFALEAADEMEEQLTGDVDEF